MTPVKVALVTGLKPAPDYGRTLIQALFDLHDTRIDLRALTSQESQRALGPNQRVEFVWSKSIFHPFQIWFHAVKGHFRLVHLQHEINLFGGAISVLLLPVLAGLLKISGLKVVITFHVVVPPSLIKKDFSGYFSLPSGVLVSTFIKWGLCWSTRVALHLSNAVVVHSPSMARSLISDYGAPRNKVHVIPHSELLISPNERVGLVDVLNRFSQMKGRKIILYFGYLVKRKGLEYLIDAVRLLHPRHKDWFLVVAGETFQPQYERDLKRQVRYGGLAENVLFTGALSSGEVDYLFQQALCVVLPAVFSFSASGPYAVALGYEKPVVAPKLGYFSEIVQDSVDGLLYEPQDARSLADAIERMMTDEGLRQRLALALKNKRPIYRADRIAQQTLDLYASEIL